jgi:hypothetical protein
VGINRGNVSGDSFTGSELRTKPVVTEAGRAEAAIFRFGHGEKQGMTL